MENIKKKQLESKGWKVGDIDELFGLSKEEVEYIDLKMSLRDRLVNERKSRGMTQKELARKMETSQSRVSKMEKGDPSVSLDLIIRSLITIGITKENIFCNEMNHQPVISGHSG